MLTYIRYALATFCFAASVGCLLLWGWSFIHRNWIAGASWHTDGGTVHASVDQGETAVSLAPKNPNPFHSKFQFRSATVSDGHRNLGHVDSAIGQFGMRHSGIYFPLWYASLVFALAGVGVLRFRRQFSIRSGLICVTVVALLLGMVVAL